MRILVVEDEVRLARHISDISGRMDTPSAVVRGANGGTRLVKEPGSSKVRAVFDPLAKSTVRMFGSRGAQSAVGEPDFCQFDAPAIGRTGVPLAPPCASHGPMAVSMSFVTNRSAMS